MKIYLALCLLFLLLPGAASAQSTQPAPANLLSADGLQRDFAVLRRAYETLHPGLYQYADKATVDAQFEQCRQALSHDQSLGEAYLAVTRLTAAFRCGHSYPNFWNQTAKTKQALFDQPNCLPLHFRVVGERLLVTRSLDTAVPVGTELRSINGHPVAEVLARMQPYVRADGSNDAKRRALLAVSGQKYEYFDILYPLLYPGEAGSAFRLQLHEPRTRATLQATVLPLSRQDRAVRMAAQYAELAAKPSLAELRWLDAHTPVLRINSFADWNTSFKLRRFLRQSFQEINHRGATNLVLDIRPLEGGNDKYTRLLTRHLLRRPIRVVRRQNTWAYTSVDTALSRYITNGAWGKHWLKRSAASFERTTAGQYRQWGISGLDVWGPAGQRFRGRTFVLISADNSSAGFQLAQVLKENSLATLVGQTTGGNQKGITAGALFFVRLPYSGIEVDVPLKGTGYDVAPYLPDAGIAPDVPVEPSLEELASGTDPELAAVQQLMTQQFSSQQPAGATGSTLR